MSHRILPVGRTFFCRHWRSDRQLLLSGYLPAHLGRMGIIDPIKVTRLALQNAASIAGLVLTGCIVVTPSSAERAHATVQEGM